MDMWKEALMQTLNKVALNPDTNLELCALLGLGCMLGIGILAKVAMATDAKATGSGRMISTALIGIVLMIVAMTAVTQFVLPNLSASVAKFALPATVLIVMLVAAVPIACGLLKFSYVSSLISWGIAVGAAVAFIYVGSIVFDTALKAKSDAGKAEDRKESLQGYIDMHE